MTITGPTMHRQLMDGYREAQAHLDELRAGLTEFETRRSELSDKRSEAMLALAQHYLPDLKRDTIEDCWKDARKKVSHVLLRKEEHRERVDRQLAKLNDRRYLQEDRLVEVNAELDEASHLQEQLAEQTEATLAADETFVTLTAQAARAEAALERAEANLDEIEQDAARKLPAYDKSTLFSYLRKEGYGTAEYQKRGFTRRMDRWLAKYVDYAKAKQGYDFLSNTPDQMRKIIAEDRSALDTVMEELETRRDEVLERAGFHEAVRKVEDRMAARKVVLEELYETRTQTEKIERELTDIEDTGGSYYQEAVEVFRDMLSGLKPRDLERRAERTPSPTDDQIVARIIGVDDQVDELNRRTRDRHDTLMEMQDCIDALGRMLQRFRASKFDSSRSSFLPSVDVLGDLHRARNSDDIDHLWDKLRRAQRWGPTFGDKVADVAAHPATQLLIGAMATAAGAAMSGQAKRAGKRRYENRRSRKFDSFWSGDSSADWSW